MHHKPAKQTHCRTTSILLRHHHACLQQHIFTDINHCVLALINLTNANMLCKEVDPLLVCHQTIAVHTTAAVLFMRMPTLSTKRGDPMLRG
jgi:hypothetical protein